MNRRGRIGRSCTSYCLMAFVIFVVQRFGLLLKETKKLIFVLLRCKVKQVKRCLRNIISLNNSIVLYSSMNLHTMLNLLQRYAYANICEDFGSTYIGLFLFLFLFAIEYMIGSRKIGIVGLERRIAALFRQRI